MQGKCELCERDNVELTEHHLIPIQYGGRYLETCMICIPCHKQIHALYNNRELSYRLYTIKRLKNDYKLSRFITWIQKQPSTAIVTVKKYRKRKNTRY